MKNKVTNYGLKALALKGDKFLQLKEIRLQNNLISDDGLKELALNGEKFKKLR